MLHHWRVLPCSKMLPTAQAFINMFAGGAILVMLADTMIPEAFEHGGKLAGVVNDTAVVLGFRAQIVFRHWMRRYAVAARTGLRIA